MVHARDIWSALRLAGLWLLVISVLLGPAGLAGSAELASSKTCAASCPCDEAVHQGEDGAQQQSAEAEPCHDADAHAGHDDGEPCKDECPDDCPNCGCCLGLAMAVLPLAVTSNITSCAVACNLSPVDAAANGSCTGVFRPPRSLT